MIIDRYERVFFWRHAKDSIENAAQRQLKKWYNKYFKNHPALELGKKDTDKNSKHALVVWNIAKRLSRIMGLEPENIYIIVKYKDNMTSHAHSENETLDEMFDNIHQEYIQLKEKSNL